MIGKVTFNFKYPVKVYGDRGQGIETGEWVKEVVDNIINKHAFDAYQSLGSTPHLFMNTLSDFVNAGDLMQFKGDRHTLYIQKRENEVHILVKK